MIKRITIKLCPNKRQEKLMQKSCSVKNFTYNWVINKQKENYKNNNPFISHYTLRKEFTKFRNTSGNEWLKQVSSEIPQQAIKDADNAYKRFFKNKSGYPRYKNYKSKRSFFHLGNKIIVNGNKIKLEKIGWMRMFDDKRMPQGNYKINKTKVYDPRVSFNGKFWELSIGIDINTSQSKLTKETIGIDLGIKDTAILSNKDNTYHKIYKNINKTKRVKKLRKRLKRLERRLSKKILQIRKKLYPNATEFKKGQKLKTTNNIIKLQKKIKNLYYKTRSVKKDYNHKTTTEIINAKPKEIIIEDLNVKGMMRRHNTARGFQQQALNEFVKMLTYKSELYGIKLITASRWCPSSRMCNVCKKKKKKYDSTKQPEGKWSLKIRKWTCINCKTSHDRDINAAINLANYIDNIKNKTFVA